MRGKEPEKEECSLNEQDLHQKDIRRIHEYTERHVQYEVHEYNERHVQYEETTDRDVSMQDHSVPRGPMSPFITSLTS